MSFNKENSGLKVKQEHLKEFSDLVYNQINHGGDKYSLSKDKEFTDGICEIFPGESGVDWILGTILKYLGRYKNFGREKDLLKIASYTYILWLKGGFSEVRIHDEDTSKDGKTKKDTEEGRVQN